jgi:hypothetical protein
MKILNQTERWSSKVNFVDENNVFLGYDMEQTCCEDADWFIGNEPHNEVPVNVEALQDVDVSAFMFDTSYFKQAIGEFDCGGMVIFRITNGEQEKFIHLFNVHNGYYAHGFEFRINDTLIKEDSL